MRTATFNVWKSKQAWAVAGVAMALAVVIAGMTGCRTRTSVQGPQVEPVVSPVRAPVMALAQR